MNKMMPSEIIHVDENGNLEVDGAIKLSGGLKPIHEYRLGKDNKLQVLFEEEDLPSAPNSFAGIGYIVDENNSIVLCMYYCEIENGGILEDSFDAIDCLGNTYKLSNGLKFTNISDELSKKQAQLYTHTLTLTADKSYTLIYQSSSQFTVDSIVALRTMLNVTATSDNVILPVCATDLSGTAVLQVTTALCKIGTANVTAVSDNVTAL